VITLSKSAKLFSFKVDCSGKRLWSVGKFEDFETHFRIKIVLKRLLKLHQAPHRVGQLYGVPHGILKVFNTILEENKFQNPQIFQQTISPFPEHSTLVIVVMCNKPRLQLN
jgi:hypothetical protein